MKTKGFTPEELLGSLNEVERKHAPATLFAAGRVELLKRRPRVSVIGSREASPQGLELAQQVARAIVRRGGVVVSGLADGVDTAAHRSTMESGGDTIAVIGTPLSRAYPRQNEELQHEIMRKQLLVSEFGEGTATTRKSFVLRNRTMALLSNASVIIEASASSGTQHQGWEALRLGRALFIPANLLDADFDWPRQMRGYGAFIFDTVTIFETLLDEFLPTPPEPIRNTADTRAASF